MKEKNGEIKVVKRKRNLCRLLIFIVAIVGITFIATSNKDEIDNTTYTMNLGSNIHIQSKMSIKIEPKVEIKKENKIEPKVEVKKEVKKEVKEEKNIVKNNFVINNTG